MTSYRIQVWFDGDIGPASIEYSAFRAGNNRVRDHNSLLKQAEKKFPNFWRIKVETVETTI